MALKLYLLTPSTMLRASLVIFLGIDSLCLGLVAPKFHRSQIGHLMAGVLG